MTDSWINFLRTIEKQTEEWESDGCDSVCFRGHANSTWNLSPSLFVKQKIKSITDETLNNLENIVYFDFVTNAGTLLRDNITSWEILFEMRHHGIPTRVLDWTESFGTALFFALSAEGDSPCIWMLDPYELNRVSYNACSIPNPLRDLGFTYCDAYIDNKSNPYRFPIAIIAPRTSDRLFAQKGLFTLQGSDSTPINLIPDLASCIVKHDIPKDAIEDAKNFLKLAGINNYSIFPDLDGLSKHLNVIHHLD
jgi:hypothetical protein